MKTVKKTLCVLLALLLVGQCLAVTVAEQPADAAPQDLPVLTEQSAEPDTPAVPMERPADQPSEPDQSVQLSDAPAQLLASTTEREPNNDPENAQTLVVDQTVTAQLVDSSDKDYFKVVVSERGYLQLNFAHTIMDSTRNYWNVTLTNANLSVLYSTSVAGNTPNLISPKVGVAAGTYYAFVTYGSYHDARQYDLTFAFTSAGDWEAEFNNSFETPTSAQPNVPVYGAITTSNDADYFKTELTQDGALVLSFEHDVYDSTRKYWDITLYDEYYNSIASMSSTGLDTMVSTASIGLPAGTYYAKVTSSSYFWATPYTLTFQHTPATDWETEFNNTFTAADSVTPNTPIKASLTNSNDADYFMTELTQDGAVYLSFEHALYDSSSKYWSIALCDKEYNTIVTMDSTGQDTITTTPSIGLPAGTYYAKVVCSSYLWVTPYTLTFHHTPATDWETEFNNTFAAADSVEPNTPITGTISTSKDADYFKTVFTEPGTLSLSFEHGLYDSDTTYWTFVLCDENYNTVTSLNSTGRSTSQSTLRIGVPAGTYYAKVTMGSSYYHTMPYQLTFSYDPTDAWEKESNDSAGSATPIALNTAVTGRTLTNSDKDYYTFTLDAPAEISPWFDHTYIDRSNSHWTVTILDNTLQPVNSYEIPGNQTETRPVPFALDAGTYYVYVKSGDYYYATYEYTLTLHSVIVPPATVTFPVGTLHMAEGDIRWLTETAVEGLTWSSSDVNIATVTRGGVVTAKAPGAATISAVTEDGVVTALCTVEVAARTGEDYTLGPITLQNAAGENLTAIPQSGSFWATVPVTKNAESGNANVILAAYGADGRMLRVFAAAPTGLGQGSSVSLRFSLDLSGVRSIKAFAVSSLGDLTPLASVSEFPG